MLPVIILPEKWLLEYFIIYVVRMKSSICLSVMSWFQDSLVNFVSRGTLISTIISLELAVTNMAWSTCVHAQNMKKKNLYFLHDFHTKCVRLESPVIFRFSGQDVVHRSHTTYMLSMPSHQADRRCPLTDAPPSLLTHLLDLIQLCVNRSLK